MSDQPNLERRNVLRISAAALAVAFAGCAGSSGGSTEQAGGSSGDSTGSGSDGGSDGGSGGDSDFGGWFSDVDNYDGVVDKTGQDSVTVQVGSEANGGNFGFSPAAVRVSTGTEVVWEWTGKGSQHNVAAEDGSFESEMTDEEGYTFSQTFDSAGTVKYLCTPHESLGMKGAVVVE